MVFMNMKNTITQRYSTIKKALKDECFINHTKDMTEVEKVRYLCHVMTLAHEMKDMCKFLGLK